MHQGTIIPRLKIPFIKEAEEASRHQQIQFLEPKLVVGLIDNSKIQFVDDAELTAGKPLPDARRSH